MSKFSCLVGRNGRWCVRTVASTRRSSTRMMMLAQAKRRLGLNPDLPVIGAIGRLHVQRA